MELTISRDLTINCGNYSSIKPSVSVTVNNLEENTLDVEYNRVSNLLDALMAKEILKLGDEMSGIQDMGFRMYLEELKKSEERLDEEIRKYVDGKLYKL